ncbi:hypothetical protein CS0771_10180 [Catellatospora sp. IY07-71]|uniref:DUF3048 domain-containing protein n=1 Tax=Catellatospora sp. IY07-71 TaxID=2728827 RepID=UPI001BB2F6E6|nr:DUF3048 domain-containing protein [Catellatospora sp. IY07-71]BCJ71474.1 hypothetical protein CS0771_10180 [Catellatospora sp. IY07-71]
MTRRIRLSLAAALTLAALAACSVGPAGQQSDAAPDRSPFVLPSPEAVKPRAPLTGLEVDASAVSKTAVLVPIEVGTGAAAPVGLDRADIVELEFAEGRLLRAAAVYQSQPADKAGPVAAVRPADVKLLNQLRPYVAHDGTPKGFLDLLTATKLAAVTPQKKLPGFTTAAGRSYVNTGTLQAGAPDSQLEPAPLFQYAQPGEPLAATGTTPATTVVVSAPGHAPLTWKFDETSKRWQATVGGAPVTAANLVLLTMPYTRKVVKALKREVALADPIGEGKAQIFSSGQGVEAHWYKTGFYSALNILGPSQYLVRLAPGPTWVLLVPTTAKVTAS